VKSVAEKLSSKLTAHIHIARLVHCVLNKNKNYAKNFYSRPTNNLAQKIPCGRGAIFARGAHFRAIYRGTMYFSPLGVHALACLLWAAWPQRRMAVSSMFFCSLLF
jgi:hypothetical protein